MKAISSATLLACVLGVAAIPVSAQVPPAPNTISALEATIGNQVLQGRYISRAPFPGVAGDLDYGALLTEDRQFLASAALMFDAEVPLPRFRLQVGPSLNLAWLAAQTKTDIFAAALNVGARYELIESMGLAVFGTGAYSPGVLTFGNAHNMYDFSAGGELRLNTQLYVMAGYRWLKFTLINEPDDKVSNEVFAGIRWKIQ